jgi:2-polyprenyl-3-methyl-5-hydroxy-6-metoxy-1,4-benzoquinol methylase
MNAVLGAAAPPAYPFSERREMLAFVPPAARSVLDVGCGPGGFGQSLRQDDPSRELWAVEADEEVAADAARFYDRLIVGAGRTFDCVVFNDVLEHTVDPWALLRSTVPLLAPGGVVVASIPNVRNVSVVLDLVLRGNWTYRDIGILDRTHLRFFTSRSIRALFADSGFAVETMHGINPVGESHLPGPRFWALLLREFAYTGFGLRAVPR